MEIFNVDIYIETSVKGPARRRAAGMYLLQFITDSGDAVTRDGIIYREQTTENALVLELVAEAFSRLTRACSVRVNTECAHVLNAMHNHWLPQWRKNGWVNAKGKPVANAGLWKAAAGLMDRHLVEVCSGWHCYRNIMDTEIRKELAAPHALPMEMRRDVCAASREARRCPGRDAP